MEKSLDDAIGHQVVIPPADAVYKQIAQHHSGPKRGHQRPGTNFHAATGQLRQLLDRPRSIAFVG